MTNIIGRIKRAEEWLESSPLNERAVIDACKQFYMTGQFPNGFKFPTDYGPSNRAAAYINALSELECEGKEVRANDSLTPTPIR